MSSKALLLVLAALLSVSNCFAVPAERSVAADRIQATPIRVPANCDEVEENGNQGSGIYWVKNSNQLKAVFCDFTKMKNETGYEKVFGKVAVSTTSVHFLMTKAKAAKYGQTIAWASALTNVGSAMDPSTGIFTAPVNGVYHFALSITKVRETSDISIYLNKNEVATVEALVEMAGKYLQGSLHSALVLKKGDTVRLMVNREPLLAEAWPFSQFVGWLAEEYLE